MEKTYDKLIVGSWTCIEGMFSWKNWIVEGFEPKKIPHVLLPEASEKVRKNENLTGSSFGR